tara:strand:+ start:260 stop:736 length:477 start_codon:yes stop_codon:yes gene_type:complete
MIKDSDIAVLGQFIIDELGKELIKQNHRATGKLISSLDYRIIKSVEGTDLIVEMNDYGEWVNKGRRKGAKKVPIPALVEWIKQKGIATNNKKVLGIAFAIQKTIQKEGIPTNNSRAKGKRTGFIDDTIIRITAEISRRLQSILFRTIELQLDNLLRIK